MFNFQIRDIGNVKSNKVLVYIFLYKIIVIDYNKCCEDYYIYEYYVNCCRILSGEEFLW